MSFRRCTDTNDRLLIGTLCKLIAINMNERGVRREHWTADTEDGRHFKFAITSYAKRGTPSWDEEQNEHATARAMVEDMHGGADD